jgi:hypothetical protein
MMLAYFQKFGAVTTFYKFQGCYMYKSGTKDFDNLLSHSEWSQNDQSDSILYPNSQTVDTNN